MKTRIAPNINAVPRAAWANPKPEVRKRDWFVATRTRPSTAMIRVVFRPVRRIRYTAHTPSERQTAVSASTNLIGVQPEHGEQSAVDRADTSGIDVRREQPEQRRDIGRRVRRGVRMCLHVRGARGPGEEVIPAEVRQRQGSRVQDRELQDEGDDEPQPGQERDVRPGRPRPGRVRLSIGRRRRRPKGSRTHYRW